MKIRVQHENGQIETISLRGELRVSEGEELDWLHAGGMELFFTKDGYYDGWSPAPEIMKKVEARQDSGGVHSVDDSTHERAERASPPGAS